MQSRSRTTLNQVAPTTPRNRVAIRAGDSMRANENMAALMPTLTRMAAIQKDCATMFPDLFGSCKVLRLDSDKLVLAAPNAAMAARLKQQLPIVQASLHEAGWQISAISLKVQPVKNAVKSTSSEKSGLSQNAIEAFAALEHGMEKTPQNEALRIAISKLIQHHR